MPKIVEAVLDAEEFRLGQALDVDLDVTVELEPVLPTGERGTPYFWISGADLEAFETAVERDPRIRTVRRHVKLRESALLYAEWAQPDHGPVDVVDATDGTVLSGGVDDGRWTFTFRFADPSHVDEFHERADNHDLDFDVKRTYSIADSEGATYGLTEKQRTALATALREGYFRVPREITQEELATELGVQSSAVSETLRRATAELVANTLGEGPASEQ
ncbi:helix-turn-helix domain-containing protein [Haloparvum sp. PAK95]|uniref:helix-turn-helix domain-containing protein n=1 Tax=Haloparvum sp. PAK95 TaxID=3418962 RepID=UPI003D2EC8A7